MLFLTLSTEIHAPVKSHFRTHSALSESRAVERPDKGTTPSNTDSLSATFISSSDADRNGPISEPVASLGKSIPAPVGIMDPSNWNTCPDVRRVTCGRARGGKGSITTMIISMFCFPHRNMRPAKRGLDRSKSIVCRIADAPGSPFGPVLLTRRQEGPVLAAFVCSLGLEFSLTAAVTLMVLKLGTSVISAAETGLSKRLAAITRRSQRPKRIGR